MTGARRRLRRAPTRGCRRAGRTWCSPIPWQHDEELTLPPARRMAAGGGRAAGARPIEAPFGRFQLEVRRRRAARVRVRSFLDVTQHRIAPDDYPRFRAFLGEIDAALAGSRDRSVAPPVEAGARSSRRRVCAAASASPSLLARPSPAARRARRRRARPARGRRRRRSARLAGAGRGPARRGRRRCSSARLARGAARSAGALRARDHRLRARRRPRRRSTATWRCWRRCADAPARPAAAWAALLAPVAAARVAARCYDEVGAGARARGSRRAAPAELARDRALPWQARVELARLADARRARGGRRRRRSARVARAVGLRARGRSTRARSGRCRTSISTRRPPPRAARRRAGARARPRRAAASSSRRRATGGAGRGCCAPAIDGAGRALRRRARLRGRGARCASTAAPRWRTARTTRYGPRVVGGARSRSAPGATSSSCALATQAGAPSSACWCSCRGAVGRVALRRSARGAARRRAGGAPPIAAAPRSRDAATALAADYAPSRRRGSRRPTTRWPRATRLARAPAVRASGLALAGGDRARRSDPPGQLRARRGPRAAARGASAVDPGWRAPGTMLAALELEDERPRDAIDDARAAARGRAALVGARAAAGARAARARAGAATPTARSIGAAREGAARVAARAVPGGRGAAAPRRGAARRSTRETRARVGAGRAAAPTSRRGVERLRARGDLDGARSRCCGRRCASIPSATICAAIWRCVLPAEGRHDDALRRARRAGRARSARSAAARPPGRRAGGGRAGRRPRARRSRRRWRARPDVPEVRRAARALGVPLPLDGFRVDGARSSAPSRRAGARYAAPAVMVLDRAVTRRLRRAARA